MYYACEFRKSALGEPRFELVVIDRKRNAQFMIGFTIDRACASLFVLGPRRYLETMHDGCEARMWRAIKRESPGTFLDARARGWVPEVVT